MNLLKMFEMQKELDDYIVQTKGLQGQDLLPQKILALQVELGECANEWRGFKFWSNNQNSRTVVEHLCTHCEGKGSTEDPWGVYTCEECNGDFVIGTSNLLLEEYVDCLHFILSIGLDIGHTSPKRENLQEDITGAMEGFQHLFNWCVNIEYLREKYSRNKSMYVAYERLIDVFFATGYHLGFSIPEIEQAYTDKWNINKQRQTNGY